MVPLKGMEIIIGSAVSLFVQWMKNRLRTTEYGTMGITLLVSLAAAGVYTFLVDAGLWEEVAKVLIVAGAFYTFIIQRFEK